MKAHLSRRKGFPFALATTLAYACLMGTPAMSETTKIDIAPQYIVNTNGFSQVQRIFGGCVNGSLHEQMADEVRALNLNTARAYFWPLYGSTPSTPWNVAQYGGKAVPRDQVGPLWAKWFAQDFASTVLRDIRHDMLQGDQMNQLIQYKSWGLRSGLVYQPLEVDEYALEHLDATKRYYRAYIDSITQVAPTLRTDYIQLSNEPDYSHWSGSFATSREAVDAWLKLYNEVSGDIKERYPATRMIGPCLSSDTAHGWTGWNTWTVPFLTRAADIRYFNYHMYEVGANASLAWMSMRQAEGEALRGVRPQAIITETNYLLKTPQSNRFLWHAQHMFSELENPDKYALRHHFLLAYLGGENDVFDKVDGKFKFNDTYWLYWVLSQTRGDYLYTTSKSSDAVRVIATRPAPGRTVISLLNDSAASAPVSIDTHLTGIRRATTRYAAYAGDSLRHGEDAVPAGSAAKIAVTLAPHEVRSYTFDASGDAPAPKTLHRAEYFSKTVAVPVKSTMVVAIPAAQAPTGSQTTMLRLGVYTDDPLSAEQLTGKLNGNPIKVTWKSIPSDVSNEATRTTYLAEIPIPASWVKRSNSLTFDQTDADYRLMFASLVICDSPAAK
ncbi:MAG TPA: hypothetical protein VGK19_01340 [Capsulimonadaceae bacterium]|jgi:hypothetical protein